MRPGSSSGCSVPFSGCSVPFSCAASSLSLDIVFGKKKIEMAKKVTMTEQMTYPSHQQPIQVGSPCFNVVSENKTSNGYVPRTATACICLIFF